jgi:hypothetical protein
MTPLPPGPRWCPSRGRSARRDAPAWGHILR